MQRGLPQKRRIPGVDRVILVSSAKGGVGKSTVAVNIAAAFATGLTSSSSNSDPRNQKRVGLLDLDLFGPSIPKLLRLEHHSNSADEGSHDGDSAGPRLSPETNKLLPLTNYGIKSMSMGYLLPSEGSPVAWRGLMVMKAVQQLLWEVEWGGIDVLVVDMPPGTGDVQLSVGQQVIVDGAVIVTTPQDVAMIDAVKGVNMFRKIDIPILGLILNMSHYTCPHCSHPSHIFGHGPSSVRKKCDEMGIEVLGEVPLQGRICEDADEGWPTVIKDPGGEVGGVFGAVVERMVGRLWPAEEERG